jgi:hypothetical protein
MSEPLEELSMQQSVSETKLTLERLAVPADRDDCAEFVSIVETVLNNSIRHNNSQNAYVTKIDHWFDFKWLAYSGKGLAPHWNQRLTIPPFNPNRVVAQTSYQQTDRGMIKTERMLHCEARSSDYIQHFVYDFQPATTFIWYSGSTSDLDRASLMLYWSNETVPKQSKRHTSDFYVSFRKDPVWRPMKFEGISKSEFMMLND